MAKRAQSETEQTLRFIAKLALIVLILRSFIVAPFSIPSESMLPRLLIGDYLLVAKWPYGYSRWSLPFGVPLLPDMHWSAPTRGDVVVFRSPDPAPGDTDPEHAAHDVIKRVIGLPGDTIQVRGGQLILNGQAVPKDRIGDFVLPITPNFAGRCPFAHQEQAPGGAVCRYRRYRETLPGGRSYTVLDTADFPDRDNTDLYSVPAGTVFLMGDNRDDSADSRWPAPQGMGYIPMDRVEGRALVSVFSTDGSASWIRPWTWFTAARPERIGRVLTPLAAWVEATFGHTPHDPALWIAAVTHSSREDEPSYERLEFLGDRVLGLSIAEWLYRQFPGEPEGKLTRRLNLLVSGATCAEVAREIGVAAHLRLNKQAADDGAGDSGHVLGDVIESLLGALYLEAGLDAAQAWVRRTWASRVDGDQATAKHPKSALQDWGLARSRGTPTYLVIGEEGPPNNRRFTVAARLGGEEARGEGGTKREAETEAARLLLATLEAAAPVRRKRARPPRAILPRRAAQAGGA